MSLWYSGISFIYLDQVFKRLFEESQSEKKQGTKLYRNYSIYDYVKENIFIEKIRNRYRSIYSDGLKNIYLEWRAYKMIYFFSIRFSLFQISTMNIYYFNNQKKIWFC